MATPLPRLAGWLLRVSVPERWADSIADDLEADWHRRLRGDRRRAAAVAWVTMEAARIAGRFTVEGAAHAIEATRRDAREATRALIRRPRFAAAAVMTIGLGVGVHTAGFAIVDRVLLTPLPYPDADRLLEVRARSESGEIARTISSVDFDAWRTGLAPLAGLAAYQVESIHVRHGGDPIPQTLPAAHVTPDFFAVLGIAPALGRAFSADEGRLGQPGVAVIAQHVWRARFGAAPAAVGGQIDVNGQAFTIVGVAPSGVEFPPGVGLWLARETSGARLRGLQIEFASLQIIGRAQGHASPGLVADEIARAGASIAREAGRDSAPVAVPLHGAIVGSAGPALRLGWAAVACLFLIACANAAGLLLARTAARRRELAVRIALGASRVALVRHVLVEAGLLAAMGSVAGLGLAAVLIQVFALAEPGGMPRLGGVALTATDAAFAAALALMAALLVSLVPAAMAGRRRAPSMGEPAGHQFRGGLLVASQMALCVVLLVAAAATGWGLLQQVLRDPGFDPADTLVVSVQPDAGAARASLTSALYRPLLERLAAIDGVSAVAMTDHLPPMAAGQFAPVVVEGEVLDAGAAGQLVRPVGITADYFRAMRIDVVAGRGFTDAEVWNGAAVAVVDARVAARAGGAAAVGRRLIQNGRVIEIVGVAADARQGRLDDAPGPTIYRPLSSGAHASGPATFLTELHIVIRGTAEAAGLAAAVRTAIGVAPRVAEPRSLTTLSQRLWLSLSGPRFHAVVFGIFAALGLLLAASGVYALVSYVVQLHTPEVGVRIALGASRSSVVGLVLRKGLRVAVMGVVAGLVAAPAVAAAISSRLEGAAPAGPEVYAGVVVSLLVVMASACVLPAWRATRVDPVVALRCE